MNKVERRDVPFETRTVDEYIARARGFDSVDEFRAARNPKAPTSDEDLLRQARELGITPGARSDVLSAELATAKTRSERRDAVNRFMASQRSPEEARFTSWLRSDGHEMIPESRAMGEGTGSSGGNLVHPRFSDMVIHYAREYDGILKACELWETEHGEAYNRAAYSEFAAGATATENVAFTDGPFPTIAQQAWPQASTFAASYVASFQLIQDAFRETLPTSNSTWFNDSPYIQPGGSTAYQGKAGSAPFTNPTAAPQLDTLVSAALGESLGRAIAPVASTALYAMITAQGAVSDSGGYVQLGTATPITFASGATTELAQNTISADSAAQMIAGVDEAYLPSCSFYMTRRQWANILRQTDSSKRPLREASAATQTLYGFPVVLTAQASAAAASSISGPVFGDLSAGLTLRTVKGSFILLRSSEARAEYLEMYYRSMLRAGVAVRDSRAVVGVKYSTS